MEGVSEDAVVAVHGGPRTEIHWFIFPSFSTQGTRSIALHPIPVTRFAGVLLRTLEPAKPLARRAVTPGWSAPGQLAETKG